MDKEVALMIALTAVRVRVEIGDLAPIIKAHCKPEEYKTFSMAIGRVLCEINSEMIDKIFELFPDIKAEFEIRHNKYGRTYY